MAMAWPPGVYTTPPSPNIQQQQQKVVIAMAVQKTTTARKTAVKKPADHQQKAKPMKGNKISLKGRDDEVREFWITAPAWGTPVVTEVSDDVRHVEHVGVSVDLPLALFTDYEFMELLNVYDANPGAAPRILFRLLGNEKHEELKEAVRDPNTDRIELPLMIRWFDDVLKALSPNS